MREVSLTQKNRAARNGAVTIGRHYEQRVEAMIFGRGTAPESACPDCFAYPWLQDYVKENATRQGTCPSCGRRKRPLVPVWKLYDLFDNLISSYHQAEGSVMER